MQSLPSRLVTPWINHARDAGRFHGYLVTYSIYFKESMRLSHVGQIFAVMDDFGTLVEV